MYETSKGHGSGLTDTINAYGAAYLADIVAQMSGFRDLWLRLRWIVLLIGLASASILTRWFTMVFFSKAS